MAFLGTYFSVNAFRACPDVARPKCGDDIPMSAPSRGLQRWPIPDTAVILDRYPMRTIGTDRALSSAGVRLVGSATSSRDALALLAEHAPEIFVLDATATEGAIDSVALVRLARQRSVALRVIALVEGASPECVTALFEAGATACLSGPLKPEDIQATVRQLHRHLVHLAWSHPVEREKEAAQRPGEAEQSLHGLTNRELEVLALVAEGRTNRQIGESLGLRPDTVKLHLSNVYRRLGVTSRTAAALRMGLGGSPRSQSGSEACVGHRRGRALGCGPGGDRPRLRLRLHRARTRRTGRALANRA